MAAATIPEPLHGLVDDAAVFPPGSVPLDRAVREHAGHLEAPYARLLGTFVVGDATLTALSREASAAALDHPLRTTVVVGGGAGALEPAVTWATRSDALELRAVELAVRESDAGDLAPNARRLLAATDSLVARGVLEEEVAVYLEPPRLRATAPSASWLGVLDEVAAGDRLLKLRTGGTEADAFPSSEDLAACIDAALDRELAFKCTAGLHAAVRHRDPETGFEHHGFLNVLAATRAALDGAGPADVAHVLEQRDPEPLLAVLDPAALASTRRWFRSFGSCSVADPLADLTALGLLGSAR